MRECDAWDALDSCATVLKTLAASVLPFAASPQRSTFKIVSSACEDELVLSCDPAEVVDAHGLDMVAVELLREAMDGLAAAHFGRREQARLVVLGSALLAEAAALRRSGLSVWTLQSGLRCAGFIAEAAIEKMRIGIPSSCKIHIAENHMAALGDEDDVSWFFTAIEEPPQTDAEVHVAARKQGNSPTGSSDLTASIEVNDICAELCRRHNGPVESQHCFVYGRQKLVRQPQMRLFRGIACRVPQCYVSCPSGMMRQLTNAKEMASMRKQFLRSVCMDADLVSAAYDSCAPPQRRTKEQVFQNAGTLLLSSFRERQQVSEAIRMLAERGTEALLVSGEVSDAVAELCRIEGLLLVGGLPARLLHALAKDLEAEVLHGLPALASADTPELPPWQAKRALRIELVDRECSRCDFVFPLLGYRQPLLPHQSHQSGAAELVDPFWELWAAADGGMPAASVVLLESSCEPQLRQLHAELHDTFLRQLGSQPGGKVDRNWIVKAAEALEESADSADFPALMTANEEEPSVAPWLHRQGDLTGNHAACQAMASALRQIAATEADYCTKCCGDGAEEDVNLEPETGHAALAVLRRGTRLVEVILSLDEAQLWPSSKKAGRIACGSSTSIAWTTIAGLSQHVSLLRCGIHTGNVLVGNMGFSSRMKYGIVGNVTASR